MPQTKTVRLVEIAELLDVSKQRVHQLATAERFPPPLGTDSRGARFWDRTAIEMWAHADWFGRRPWRLERPTGLGPSSRAPGRQSPQGRPSAFTTRLLMVSHCRQASPGSASGTRFQTPVRYRRVVRTPVPYTSVLSDTGA